MSYHKQIYLNIATSAPLPLFEIVSRVEDVSARNLLPARRVFSQKQFSHSLVLTYTGASARLNVF